MSDVKATPDHRTLLADALVQLRTLRAKLEAAQREKAEPIAIVGMSCRFPGGATDPASFWRLLIDGRDAITEVPKERWDIDAYYDRDPSTPGKTYSRWGGFIEGVDQFDAPFFGVSRREAESMDPQQRLLLEVAWEALEDAGQSADTLRGSKSGVFMGITSREYAELFRGRLEGADAYTVTGNGQCFVAGRLSYLFDLQGPSLVVDTACSSSLVAVDLACQSLRDRKSDMALAGGVGLILLPEQQVVMSRLSALSADGRCKTFDAAADGYVRGEGCGVVVLKRLRDALADGDDVVAVILGSAVNQDGKSSALTAPNVLSQRDVLRAALKDAGVRAEQVGLIEAHGSATALGDPIEVDALCQVFGGARPDGSTCALGAVKTNIGHTEAAAGVAGLIKAVLSLKHGRIPPHLHFKRVNPNISLHDTPFVIPTKAMEWPDGPNRRIAGVSAFGLSGTNAHIVVAEAPKRDDHHVSPPADDRAQLLVMSAKSEPALRALAGRFAATLKAHGAARGSGWLRDVCFSAAVRRTHHAHRLAIVVDSIDDAATALSGVSQGEVRPEVTIAETRPGRRKIAFVFSGQGSQWKGMGQRLLAEEPAFRDAFDAIDAVVHAEAGFSPKEVLLHPDDATWTCVDVVQPVLFAMQASLAALWRSWGVEPDAVVGHSLGEIAAAHVAGGLSLHDAVKVICRRSRLVRRASGAGAMALAELDEAEVAALLREHDGAISVAAFNGPRTVLLSGDRAPIAAAVRSLDDRGAFARLVDVDYASHSPHMDAILSELVAELGAIAPTAGAVAMISTVTGSAIPLDRLDAAYWARNLREPVLFTRALDSLARDGIVTYLEISPHPVLAQSIERTLEHAERPFAVIESLRRDAGDRRAMLESLGRVYATGHRIDFGRLFPAGRLVKLPSYPWQRERYWADVALPARSRPELAPPHARGSAKHALVGGKIASSLHPGTSLWQTEMGCERIPYLADHQFRDTIVFLAGGYLEMILEAADEHFGLGDHAIEDVTFERPLVIARDRVVTMQTVLSPDGPGRCAFQIASQPENDAAWTVHARGWVRTSDGAPANEPASDALGAIARCTAETSGRDLYAAFRATGVAIGERLQTIDRVLRGNAEAVAELRSGESVIGDGGIVVHPALFDACFQLLGCTTDGAAEGTFMAAGMKRVRVSRRGGRGAWVHARRGPSDDATADQLRGDLALYDETGAIAVEIQGFQLRRVSRGDDFAGWFSAMEWVPQTSHVPSASGASTPAPRSCVLVMDRSGVGDELQRLFQASGVACTTTTVAGPIVANREITDIVYLSPLDAPDAHDRASFAEARRVGCDGLLGFVQDLARAGLRGSPRLWIVTRGTQRIGAGNVRTAQAPVWGLGRTIAIEHPELRPVLIDLSGEPTSEEIAALFGEIEGELGAPPSAGTAGENQIALRGAARFVLRFAPYAVPPSAPLRVESDGAYLVTGAFGGIGALVARFLVDRGARHIVLMSRKSPDESGLALVASLRETGARVAIATADVADEASLRAAFATLRETMPPLRGVLHVAGVHEDGFLVSQTREQFARVLSPKVEGAFYLHALTRESPLDFFVMFSSVSSVVGAPGLANYAAANAFLDALAHHRSELGLPALSVNWGAWNGVGMAKIQAERGVQLESQGLRGVSPDEGVRALERLMSGPSSQAAVLRLDVRQLRRTNRRFAELPVFAKLIADAGGAGSDAFGAVKRELAALAPSLRLHRIEHHVRSFAAQVLRAPLSKIDPETPFGELGFDSLAALEFRNRLEAGLGLILPSSLVWSYRTSRALAPHLAERMDLPLHGDLARATPDPAARPSSAASTTGDPAKYALEPIAVVGMGCRFPGGVNDPDEFWRLLRDGVDAISEVPRERWDVDAYYDVNGLAPGKMNSRWLGVIPEIDRFDAAFFKISPREAAGMDPQQRMLLEVTWEALEHAGIAAPALRGTRTGVYVGSSSNDYAYLLAQSPSGDDAFAATGCTPSLLAGRISYTLDLQGPSMVVDTACSSSLTAVDLACQALRGGGCDVALAGGVHLNLSPKGGVLMAKMMALAPDGRCKSFDEHANGIVRADGCGVVVLKRLADAIADGDEVWAVLRGSAVAQDGQSAGLTAPNVLSQQAVVRAALARAGVEPHEVSYVEGHGTGTALGDPIEIDALKAVVGGQNASGANDANGTHAAPCALGAVKANIGHTEAAAGVAGLIKAVLALRNEAIPANPHFERLNPNTSFAGTRLFVPTSLSPWPRGQSPRIAGVSAFGASGTNAHVVVAEAPWVADATADGAALAPGESGALDAASYVLPISAKSATALRDLAKRYADWLSPEHGAAERARPRWFADVCGTASARRAHHSHRHAVVAGSAEEAATLLRALAEKTPRDDARSASDLQRIVFVFSGFGSQWQEMGRRLFEDEPVFRRSVEACDAALQREAGFSVRETLTTTVEEARFHDVSVNMPLLFTMHVALAALWRSWGIEPAAVVGHSLGEVAAAHVAGALSLDDAAAVVCHRSRLLQRTVVEATSASSMAVVEMTLEAAQSLIAGYGGRLNVASHNGPDTIVLAGDTDALCEVLAHVAERGGYAKRIDVKGTGHGPSADPLLPELRAALAHVKPRRAPVPFYSTVTADIAGGEDLDAEYWAQNLRRTVRFFPTFERIVDDGHLLFLEVSPHPVLLPSLERGIRAVAPSGAAVHTVRRGEGTRRSMLASLARLYELGHDVDWKKHHEDRPRARVVPLPRYPWQRERHWILPGHGLWSSNGAAPPATAAHEALAIGARVERWFYDIAWRRSPRAKTNGHARHAGRWLVFADTSGTGEALAASLEARGDRCTMVFEGPDFAALAGGHYRIAPTRAEDCARLLRELAATNGDPWHGVVHAWGLDAAEIASIADIDRARELACATALHLVKAMVHEPIPGRPRLWLVTRNAHAVTDGEATRPDHALLWGYARNIVYEQPELRCSVIDIAGGDAYRDDLVEEIWAGEDEDRVALRDGERYVARLAPPRDDAATPVAKPTTARPAIVADATYLITGGLGGIGLEVCAWLVGQGARAVALMGRSEPSIDAAATIRRLVDRGADVRVLRGDVSRGEDVSRVLDAIAGTMPPLRGVVHAAAVSDMRLIADSDWPSFVEVTAPKVDGAWHLHTLTRGLSLDFFVLFSSGASLLALLPQGSYAAANGFLDALAHHRHAMGLPALSINWGAWTDVGGAARAVASESRHVGMPGMTPEEGLEAFGRLLFSRRTQVAVFPLQGAALESLAAYATQVPFLRELGARRAETQSLRERVVATDPAMRREMIVHYIVEQAATALQLPADQIGESRPFTDFGFDSIMAFGMKTRIEMVFGVAIPVVRFVKGPTASEIAGVIVDALSREGAGAHRSNGAPAEMPMISADLAHRFEPFPLTELQRAHWLRDEAGSASSSHFYVELEREGLDVERLERAWAKVVDEQDMLRAVLTPDGRQRILETVPRYAFETLDLRGASDAEAQVMRIRDAMRGAAFDPSRWPLFAIRATLVPNGKTRLHLAFDSQLVDATTGIVLFSLWAEKYRNPEAKPAPLGIGFRDYVLAEIAARESDVYRRARAYWLARLPDLAAPPPLPRASRHGSALPRFVSRAASLPSSAWRRVKQRGRAAALTPSVIALTALAEAIGHASGAPRFTIALTFMNRLPIHPDVNRIVGSLVSTVLLAVDVTRADFDAKAAAIRDRLMEDLNHSRVSGIEVCREWSRARGAAMTIPVVFSSALGLEAAVGASGAASANAASDISIFGQPIHQSVMTHGADLDCHVSEKDGALHVAFSSRDDVYRDGLVDELLAATIERLAAIARDAESTGDAESEGGVSSSAARP